MRRRLLFAALIFVLPLFPYGPLFPWSPVRPGYVSEHFQRADVIHPSHIALPEDYRKIDSLIAEAEQFHRLPMPHRLTVIACGSWEDFHRFVPHLRGRAVAAVTLLPGTVIYVTPKIDEKGLELAEFLRHELSHATLNQNQSAWNGYKMTQQQWFSEGLAVSFGRQRAYLSRDEFLAWARHRDLGPTIDPDQRTGKPTDIRFAYGAWRYFLEDLIATRGRDPFQRFLLACMNNPDHFRESFRREYDRGIAEAVRQFEERLPHPR